MCVIVYCNINGERILAKNRDRTYNVDLVIVHEIVNGVEIAYIKDLCTNWVEGINEFGIGLINSALNVKQDELDGTNNFKTNVRKTVIRTLSVNNLSESINEFSSNKNHKPVYGFTIISDPSKAVIIEAPSKLHPTIITDISKRKRVVLTNHGNYYPDTGYTNGRKRISSILRQEIVKEELKNVNDYIDILDAMNKNYENLDPRMSPYRNESCTLDYIGKVQDGSVKVFKTTTQLLMNLSRLELIVNVDKNSGKFHGIINKLPEGYVPKIDIIVFNQFGKNEDKSKLPINNKKISYLTNQI